MTIVVTGGGSGGHITPLLAVAAELKALQPDARIVYIGQRGDRFGDIVRKHPAIDAVHTVYAGKFRRYHTEGLKQLLDLKTLALNVRDFFLFVIGCVQSFFLLLRLKPQVLFVKGGFVGVPVGLAAAALRVPYVTHDSDALAGLANRIISRWARIHAVALPAETYAYPAERTVTVGVPIAAEYSHVNSKIQSALKEALGFDSSTQMLLVTGGGLGAKTLNDAVVRDAQELLEMFPALHIVHSAGAAHAEAVAASYQQLLSPALAGRVTVYPYITDMYRYSGAADIVIARAGATNMAELAAQAKACIMVPNPYLTGGHQLKNARAYAEAGAAEVIDQLALADHPKLLVDVVIDLLSSPAKRAALGGALHRFAHPNSARELAKLILKEANSA